MLRVDSVVVMSDCERIRFKCHVQSVSRFLRGLDSVILQLLMQTLIAAREVAMHLPFAEAESGSQFRVWDEHRKG
jgi:hypothetical protein